MREAGGHSFKSSLSHTWVHDTRDDRLTGTHGLYAKIYQELAGIGGDAKFHKIEVEGQLSRSLCPGTVRHICRFQFYESVLS
jgi:outer membrane protein insertion porin family